MVSVSESDRLLALIGYPTRRAIENNGASRGYFWVGYVGRQAGAGGAFLERSVTTAQRSEFALAQATIFRDGWR
jgi:hypothetical protein